ncbi:hypothetical protein LIER_22991 [Lithospermum erythrorhizon]|uniref:Peptidase A2 domain-containing protein n=1 Tax=Lithospermum erythrorhizon TaxID=34254 RepID=A0AAV3QYD8_LITER
MLVDTGSSADILYLNTYDKLHLPRSHIQPIVTPLTGFTGHVVYTLGITTLDLTLGTGNKTTTIKASAQCGGHRWSLWKPKRARICYQASVPPVNKPTAETNKKRCWENQLEVRMVREGEEEDNSPREKENQKRPIPYEDVEEIPFNLGDKGGEFKTGTRQEDTHREALI